MPRSRDQAHYIKNEQWSLQNFRLHLAERSVREGVQVHAGKAHGPRMPENVDKGDAAGPALGRIHPVAGPGIFHRISVSAVPDVETVECVERDWQPDAEQLKKEDQREICEKAHL